MFDLISSVFCVKAKTKLLFLWYLRILRKVICYVLRFASEMLKVSIFTHQSAQMTRVDLVDSPWIVQERQRWNSTLASNGRLLCASILRSVETKGGF